MIVVLKSIFTLYTCIIIWHYWKSYGVHNFLWISDIGLLLTLAALWLQSMLLVSICFIAFLVPEVVWNIDFFITLILGKKIIGASDYMFDSRYTLFLRLLSLFHVLLPTLWIGLILHWGYDSCAVYYAIPMIWIIAILTYRYTDPAANINWIFIPVVHKWVRITTFMWLSIVLIGYPLLVCLPIHMISKHIFKPIQKESCLRLEH